MRMWNVDPMLMCNKHLLGEHVEMHMFHGSIMKGTSLSGYIKNGLVETTNIQRRHDALVSEMAIRGMKHSSPLEYTDSIKEGLVDVRESTMELAKRCPDCRHRIILYGRYKSSDLPDLQPLVRKA